MRKLGVPGQEELAMGAAATGRIRALNEALIRALGISDGTIESVAAEEERELQRREQLYRSDSMPRQLKGKTLILVDDGLATGSTMHAAVLALRRQEPGRFVVAVPVAAISSCEEFNKYVDQIVCARTPEPFYFVGEWYDQFSQTSYEEVQYLLRRASSPAHEPAPGSAA